MLMFFCFFFLFLHDLPAEKILPLKTAQYNNSNISQTFTYYRPNSFSTLVFTI